MATYTREQLVYKDGKLYAYQYGSYMTNPSRGSPTLVPARGALTEVTRKDKVDGHDVAFYKNVVDLLGIAPTVEDRSLPQIRTGNGRESRYIYQQVENPEYKKYDIANPLAADSRGTLLNSSLSDAIYGREYGGLNTSTYTGRELTEFRSRDGGIVNSRAKEWGAESPVNDQWSTTNAESVQAILKVLYPNASQDQLDAAALAAINEGGEIRRFNRNDTVSTATRKPGDSYTAEMLPTDIARGIVKQMGATQSMDAEKANAWLTKIETDTVLPYMKQYDDAAHKYSKSTSGIRGFLGSIPAPFRIGAAILTGGTSEIVIGGANVAVGLNDGNMKQVASGALSMYGGSQYGGADAGYTGTAAELAADGLGGVATSGVSSAAPSFIDAISSSITNIDYTKIGMQALANAGTQYAITGDVNWESVAAGAAGNVVGQVAGNTASSMDVFGNSTIGNAGEAAIGGAFGGATSAAIRGGDISDGALAGGLGAGFSSLVDSYLPKGNGVLGSETVRGAVTGAGGGLINTAVNGGKLGENMLVGAVSGGTSGALQDSGIITDRIFANAAGNIVGSYVNGKLQDDVTTIGGNTGTGTGTGNTTTTALPSFSLLTANYIDLSKSRTTPNWLARDFTGG